MATECYYRWTPPIHALHPPGLDSWKPTVCTKEVSCAPCNDPGPSVPPHLLHVNLTKLQTDVVENAKGDHTVRVQIFIGNTGKTINIKAKASDTIEKLKQQLQGDLGPEVFLAFRGKPVGDKDRLCDLNIINMAQFVTYHRCHGG